MCRRYVEGGPEKKERSSFRLGVVGFGRFESMTITEVTYHDFVSLTQACKEGGLVWSQTLEDHETRNDS